MPFLGTPVVTMLSDRACLVTGVQVASSVTGTIGFAGSGADVELPAAFQAFSYDYQGNPVTLDQCVRAEVQPVSSLGLTNIPPSVAYTGTVTGLNPPSFRINITNTSTSLSTQTLAILVQNFAGGVSGQPNRLTGL